MKKFKKILAIALAFIICLSITSAAYAATSTTALIDTSAKASLNLYKYDFTSASEDGVLTGESYVSNGSRDTAAESALAKYAIKGVEFTYKKVADISTYSALESKGYTDMVLYYFSANNAATTEFLNALGLTDKDAYIKSTTALRFKSDTLIDALAQKLEDNSSILKNNLEQFVATGGTAMPETDANGHSSVSNLDLGLYILVETRVPENVKSTTAPFLVSLPMTTSDGEEWNYDVTVYPKNETDSPNLDKTLRESKADTGIHNGSTNDIKDGYADTATGSDGDIVDYQVISTLPQITSNATALTKYTFVDTLSKGIEYNKKDVKIEWFKDAACKDLITTWNEDSGKFSVTYGNAADSATTMTIAMTAAGLNEINNSTAVYSGADTLFRGYSSCTIRITYACTVNSNAEVVYGDKGNPNEVTLTWSRTNTKYEDTLRDHCHFYTYAIDLTKEFSDELGNFAKVSFLIYNDTDNYWVTAELNESEGVYYVTDHEAAEKDATAFVPVTSGDDDGKVIVKGLEDDAYIVTETTTDSGYSLLKDDIDIVITSVDTEAVCNEPGTVHHLKTAIATVNGDTVAMTQDNSSAHAIVPLTVVNTRVPLIPKTGVDSAWIYGTIIILATAGVIMFAVYKRKKANEAE